VVEHLPSMHKALGLSPRTGRNKTKPQMSVLVEIIQVRTAC
jgi:hypothetical protein